jgi:hypothetical protein
VKQGLVADDVHVWTRPAEFAAEISNAQITGESSFYTTWWGGMGQKWPLIGAGGQIPHSSPKILGAVYTDPAILNAAAKAIMDAKADAIYITRVSVEEEDGILYFKYKKTVKVEGKAVKLKYIGMMSEAKADDLRVGRFTPNEKDVPGLTKSTFSLKFW